MTLNLVLGIASNLANSGDKTNASKLCDTLIEKWVKAGLDRKLPEFIEYVRKRAKDFA